ncbi:unnamed protein product [Linum trigynum]|uniref:Uncharacterized protein n=1 Tax=Linum trigynum TaxID=586398 RepID=A0AAV2CNT6_9ROSI
MGPLTSSYVLCGSREANEGKLFELSPPAAYVVGGLLNSAQAALKISIADPRTKLSSRPKLCGLRLLFPSFSPRLPFLSIEFRPQDAKLLPCSAAK